MSTVFDSFKENNGFEFCKVIIMFMGADFIIYKQYSYRYAILCCISKTIYFEYNLKSDKYNLNDLIYLIKKLI